MNTALPTVCWVRALHDYPAETTGDLTLTAGDVIQVHDNDGDWWKGTRLPIQEYGTFPSNFVEFITAEQAQTQLQSSYSGQRPHTPTPPIVPRPNIPASIHHSRQPSQDGSTWTKRRPVNKAPSIPSTASNNPMPQSSHMTVNYPTASTVRPTSPSPAHSRRNPQAIVHQDMLCSSTPSESLFPNHNQNTPLPVPPVTSAPASPMTRLTQKLVSETGNSTSQTSESRPISHSRRSSVAASIHQGQLKKNNETPATPQSTKSSLPGAWPEPSEEENRPTPKRLVDNSKEMPADDIHINPEDQNSIHITNGAVYDPHYATRKMHSNGVASHPNPLGPAREYPLSNDGSLHPNRSSNLSEPYAQSRLMNRRSMPDLGLDVSQSSGMYEDTDTQMMKRFPASLNQGIPSSGFYMQETDRQSGTTKSTNHLPMPGSVISAHSSAAPTPSAPIIHPKPIKAMFSKPFSPPPPSNLTIPPVDGRSHQNNFTTFAAIASAPTPKEQQLYQEKFQQQLEEQEKLTYSNSVHRPGPSDPSPGNTSNHNRLQAALENLESRHSPQSPVQQGPLEGGPDPSITIPNPRQSSFQTPLKSFESSIENASSSAFSPPFSRRQSMPLSPPTPSTAVTTITSGTPDWSSPRSAGTSMSDASILMTMTSPSSVYHLRNRASLSSCTTVTRHSSESARSDAVGDGSQNGDDIGDLDSPDPDNLPTLVDGRIYHARKPKATLMRAIKQIVNPRKVAEKDALKSQQDHIAWVEMQKSLKRVRSPEPGGKYDFQQQYFASATSSATTATSARALADATSPSFNAATPATPFSDVDPFEALKFSYNLKDPSVGASLDHNPSSFTQADKLARNVNQKSPQLTPQILSQKYLTRPYARSPLLKLRVLFIWVSENIRLEGGPMRDVSGGRYKLGPAGDVASTFHTSANGSAPPAMTSAIAKAINQTLKANSTSSPRKTPASSSANLATATTANVLSPNGSSGVAGNSSMEGAPTSAPVMSAATAAAFMQGLEDCSKGFLVDDAPERAQDVLTNRVCRTGEGFANLFAEMAMATGIEEVGVVKGHLKGPMDVFAKDIPPPNHAWNVVKIDGCYRFIDCCLASPFYPGHYPNRSKEANSFYFLTLPSDLVLTHFPTFMTHQYIAPPITPPTFLQFPFVRPAFFDYGLRFLDFKKRTRLDIKDDQPVEVFLVIGAGEGIELRAEVEAMTAEGKVIKKRALAQVTVWRLNPNLTSSLGSGMGLSADGEESHKTVPTPQAFSLPNAKHGGATSQLSALAAAGAMATIVPLGSGGASLGSPGGNRLSGRFGAGVGCIRIAKIKAVLPPETVMSVGGIRKGVVHIYAGRKVENALTDTMPYPLAVTLPIRHTGVLPKTAFSFVLPHFSPYEYYIKAPQSELLYYPHTYKFSILSLAALSQASITPLSNPIQWTDLSPSSSSTFESPTSMADDGISHTPSTAPMASPPPLPCSSASATPAGGTAGRVWPPNSNSALGGLQTRRPNVLGSSASIAPGTSVASNKVSADQSGALPPPSAANGYASTLTGPKPSYLNQRRGSHQYTGGSGGTPSHPQPTLPPAPVSQGSSSTALHAPSGMLSPYGSGGGASSASACGPGSSKLQQHPSSSSLANSLRPSSYPHHYNMSASSSSATLGAMGAGGRRLSSSSASSISIAGVTPASAFAQSIGSPAIPRPERLVLRSQTNRIYKLVYDPLRQCHEAQIEIKERGLWECVRFDDGGKGRVGREGASGVVIASWKCV